MSPISIGKPASRYQFGSRGVIVDEVPAQSDRALQTLDEI